MKPIVYHIPICPFSQRLEILLTLKGERNSVDFRVVDITKPRDPRVIELAGGSTALPVLELDGGRSLKESLVLMSYFEDAMTTVPVRKCEPYDRARENMLGACEGDFVSAGYAFVMNQDASRREHHLERYKKACKAVNDCLERYATSGGPWFFDSFGWCEAIFTPFFQRFEFIEHYEEVDPIVDDQSLERLRDWREACVTHDAAQQVEREQIIKLYYDYSRGAGNGSLPPDRSVSSFVFEPHWSKRPMPPRGKPATGASDNELGLMVTE